MLKATEAPAGIQGQTGSEEPPDTLIRYVSQVVDEEPYQSFLPGIVRVRGATAGAESLGITQGHRYCPGELESQALDRSGTSRPVHCDVQTQLDRGSPGVRMRY
jgi:hypothetical protein